MPVGGIEELLDGARWLKEFKPRWVRGKDTTLGRLRTRIIKAEDFLRFVRKWLGCLPDGKLKRYLINRMDGVILLLNEVLEALPSKSVKVVDSDEFYRFICEIHKSGCTCYSGNQVVVLLKLFIDFSAADKPVNFVILQSDLGK